MQKVRVDVHLEYQNYLKLLGYTAKRSFKNASQAVDSIIKEYFSNTDSQSVAVDRLNKVIQEQQDKIQNLEFELRTKRAKVIKDVKSK